MNTKTITIGPSETNYILVRKVLAKQQKSKKSKVLQNILAISTKKVSSDRNYSLISITTVVPVTGSYVGRTHNAKGTRSNQYISRTSKRTSTDSKLLEIPKIPTTKTKFKKRKKKLKTQSTDKRKIILKPNNLTKTRKGPEKSVVIATLLSVLADESEVMLTEEHFVFRPEIAINEINCPLDNPEKPDLYSQDSTVHEVLSYGFADPAVKNYIEFPSVSKIIEETISDKSKLILGNWRQKMADELGEEGFLNHSEALKLRGTEFHMAVRNAVLGNTTDNCSRITQNSLRSLSWMLQHISNPMAVESTIAHPKLGYRGVADCIAMFRNIPVLIDWKLSDKPKRKLKNTYDAPVQVTAYIGALNHDPNYKWGVNHGLVVVAYANGDPCDVFVLAPKHCQIYWRHWLMRLDKFKTRSHLHLEHSIDEKSLGLI